MMHSVDDFSYLVRNYCPNLPDFIFSRAFIKAAREYFKRTGAWTDTRTAMPDANGNVTIEADSSSLRINKILRVEFEGRVLSALHSLPEMVGTGKTEFYFTQSPRSLKLLPPPKELTQVSVMVSQMPAMSANRIDTEVVEDNAEGLIAGTVADIKSMPGTDWYEPNQAFQYSQQFKMFIDDKRIDVMQRYGVAEQTIHVPDFM